MAVGVTVALAGPAMCSASSVGVENCSGKSAKLAAISSIVVSGAAGTCGSFHLMNVLLSADDSGINKRVAPAIQTTCRDEPRLPPAATCTPARPARRPVRGRVGTMPSIGTETRIVSSGIAATIVPKKLCPNPWASTYA